MLHLPVNSQHMRTLAGNPQNKIASRCAGMIVGVCDATPQRSNALRRHTCKLRHARQQRGGQGKLGCGRFFIGLPANRTHG